MEKNNNAGEQFLHTKNDENQQDFLIKLTVHDSGSKDALIELFVSFLKMLQNSLNFSDKYS